MATEKEIAIQIYLHERESELGSFFLRCIEAKRLNRAACIEHGVFLFKGDFEVTPQEELFAGFFNNEKALIADMSTLELRAHREELAKIAFEARARLTAVDDEERARKAKNQKEKGATGFSTSLQTDEVASDAINRVKTRQTKMNKVEKTIEGLVKMGMDRKEAEKMVSAGTLLARIKEKAAKPVSDEPIVPVVNPFAPKPTPPTDLATEVTIVEETNTVIVKTEEPKPAEPKPFNNPFAK